MPIAKEIAEALRKCNKCGFCLAGCPIYKVTGVEWETARGRIEMVRSALLEHRLELDEIEDPVGNCLTCNNCVPHCPAGLLTGDIIFYARQEILKQRGDSWVPRLVFRKLLARPSLLHQASLLLRLADITGLRAVARKTGLTRLIGDAGRAEAMVPRTPAAGGVTAIARLPRKIENPKYKVAYFTGCYAPNLAPEKAAATIRVLQKHQAEVTVPEFACCGLPAAGYGDTSSARDLARRNINIARQLAVDAIVTPCASCSSFLKDYTKLLADEPEWSAKAKKFSDKIRDLSEFLVDIGLVTEMGEVRKKVTYHDPCHLAHFQKITEPPRTILKSISGVEFIEMGEANMCCGAAGTYAFKKYDLSMKVLARKMGNVSQTGADILASSCPACVMQLASGAKQHKIPVNTLEIVEILDQAYRMT
ncbi:MAG: (Fe-S)-binding protein [Dehalococcoidales bacterium]|jgi:glycolate oxidase iron-sulfur subunit|nr:(Fe-S)-binding protein [Dehalococcoidales bacterium]MDP7285927.1 (Fe-S)-binding protein [Dehalococcoidales bacterium]